MSSSDQLKGAVKQMWKNQRGLAFPLALVVLGISVLLMVPFLGSISTGSITSRKSIVKTAERYAADAAFEDALWNLTKGNISIASEGNSTSYSLTEAVNGVVPNVTVTREADGCGDVANADEPEGCNNSFDDIRFHVYKIEISAGDVTTQRNVTTDYFCMGLLATIVGTKEADNLTGTSGSDVIVALDGDDTIDGKVADDVICGGAGNESIEGQSGSDTIYGGSGNDTIKGGSQSDTIYGGSGNDTIKGEEDSDTIYGGSGSEGIDGGPGEDFCDGGEGSDGAKKCETMVNIPYQLNK